MCKEWWCLESGGKESESYLDFFLIVWGWTSGLQSRTGAKACVSQKLRGLGNGSDLANIRQNVLRTWGSRGMDGCGKKVCWKFQCWTNIWEGNTGVFVCVKRRKFNLILMFWEVREGRGCREQEDRSISLTSAQQKTWFFWFNREIAQIWSSTVLIFVSAFSWHVVPPN